MREREGGIEGENSLRQVICIIALAVNLVVGVVDLGLRIGTFHLGVVVWIHVRTGLLRLRERSSFHYGGGGEECER